MIKDPEFSIIIPTYNNIGLFKKSFNSVLAQKNVTTQIIIVDDSNENNDIEEYMKANIDSHIVYLHNKPSLGAVKNWNYGLNKAKGKYIVLMHHDEAFIEDYALHRISESLKHNNIVICNLLVRNINGKSYILYPTWIKKLFIHVPSLLFLVNAFGATAVFSFKKELLTHFDDRLKWFVDVEWFFRLMKNHSVYYLPYTFIESYHGHKYQITNTINQMLTAKNDATIIKKKYANSLIIRIALIINIYILHNRHLHKILKTLFRR